jgi:hypothetical protein
MLTLEEMLKNSESRYEDHESNDEAEKYQFEAYSPKESLSDQEMQY